MTRYRRLLLVQLPLIALWTCAFLVARCGDEGRLADGFVREHVYPTLRRLEGAYTDLKFNLRGEERPRSKIVIVAIDDKSVAVLGRWPWHRDAIAALVMEAGDAGAKAIGLDIVFPEPDQRVSDPVGQLLTQLGYGDQIPRFETDLTLQRIVDLYKDRLVLGWMSDDTCQPRLDGDCKPADPDNVAALPDHFEKFGYGKVAGPRLDAATTPLPSAQTVVGNLQGYFDTALHAGFLDPVTEEPDDVTRRAQVVLVAGGHAQPSLPLEMARIGTGEDLDLALADDGYVERLGFARSGRAIDVDATGALAINFRGGIYHYPYVSAVDLIDDSKPDLPPMFGIGPRVPRADVFKDAYVLIGVSAAGARDLKHFPFGKNILGTEGLATILDNLLAGDPLRTEAPGLGVVTMLVLMLGGGAAFGLAMLRLSALPALLSSLATIGAIAALDVYVVFGRLGVDLHSVFLLGELATIFVTTVAVKYIVEERGKTFIRSTFSKYLAPTVVDEMLKDPSKLALGGETRRLTIMMSDLRGFTAMAERMKPHEVLSVLNHYLGTMADIIMEFGGTIDEFIGDAILVIFGAPLAADDDARRAVACAIAMQRAMKPINEHNARLGLPRLEMGIALNTGEVIVGNIGSQKHIKYGVVGSHVNLTARIESNTVGGQVLISGATLELAGDGVTVGERQLIVAKGFPQPIPAFEVKGIGAPYHLAIEEVDLGLAALAAPVEVRFRVMKGKNEEGDERGGRFTALSAMGATLAVDDGDAALDAFSNLKLRVAAPGGDGGGALVDGDLYAKVIGAGASATLRFTAVPPAVEKVIAAVIAKGAGAAGASEAPPAAAPAPPGETERSSELAERD